MRQPVKLIIKKGKIHKDGVSLIFLQYCNSKTKKILIGTDISFPENYWDRKIVFVLNNLAFEYGDSVKLGTELRN